jgi:hypothetical protein
MALDAVEDPRGNSMNIIRKAISTFAGISLAVLLFAALAPKATRGVAAALVQVTNTSANPVPDHGIGRYAAASPFTNGMAYSGLWSNHSVVGGDPLSWYAQRFRAAMLHLADCKRVGLSIGSQ